MEPNPKPDLTFFDWPRYEDNRPIHIVRVDDWFFVDWRRSSEHACLYYEYGLVDHVRCRVCGRVKRRDEIPFFTS